MSFYSIRPAVVNFFLVLFLTVLAGRANDIIAVRPGGMAPATSAPMSAEQIRTDCIKGRRLICGRVLKISPGGLVVDSGYTDLLRPPLIQSWVASGTVSVKRNPAVLELNVSGTPCIGLAFLTDLPKKPEVKIFDYVILMGYPCGQYVYMPAPGVEKTIRSFSAGLDTAVRLKLQAEVNPSPTNAPVLK